METNQTVQVVAGRGAQFKILGRYYRYIDPVIHDPLIRGYFEIVATILLVAFFVVVAIRPTASTITKLVKEISDMEKVDTALTQKIDNLISAQSNYSQVSGKIKYLERGLPPKPEVDLLISDLEEILVANNLTMDSLTVEGTGLTADAWKANPKFVENELIPLGFSLSIKADFSSGEKLLEVLDSARRLIEVDTVSFSSQVETNSELTISYKGIAYFLP